MQLYRPSSHSHTTDGSKVCHLLNSISKVSYERVQAYKISGLYPRI